MFKKAMILFGVVLLATASAKEINNFFDLSLIHI